MPARNSGSIGVICLNKRIDDALNATCAVVEQAIVPGSGVALLWASRSLKAKGRNESAETTWGAETT